MSVHATSLFGAASLLANPFHFSEQDSRPICEIAAELCGNAADLNGELPAVFAAFERSPEQGLGGSGTAETMKAFRLILDNDKTKVTDVVEQIVAECEAFHLIDEAVRFKVCIALEEALLNAIIHGNLEVSSELRERGDDSFEQLIEERCSSALYGHRQVTVDCRLTRESATFVITDEGPGFDVRSVPDPTDPDYLERPCGRGMLLMRSFMDEVRYSDRGNSVTLVKRAPQPDPRENG